MKKLLLLFTLLTFTCSIFAQYTGNKLPSGLTVATTVDSADYTIIQKNGETIVKAVRMDTLKTFFSDGIIESIVVLDSVSGSTGQFIISDGSGWLTPASAKYEGDNAYTFGSRLSGTIGSGSMVIGRGRATGTRSNCINGITASGDDAISINGSFAAGDQSVAILGSTTNGTASVGIMGGTTNSYYSIAMLNGLTYGENTFSVGDENYANSYGEIVFGQFNDTAAISHIDSWVATDRLFTIGNGTSSGSESNALVMLKNGNTTFSGNITADTITGYIQTQNAFAEIYYADASTAQSIPNGTTYTKITAFTTDGEEKNCKADAANDKITITETGYYQVTGFFSTICATNGTVGKTALFAGGTEVSKIHKQSQWTNTVTSHSGSIGGILKVEKVPIDIDVRIRHDQAGAVNFTGVYGNLSVRKISEL